MYDIHVHSSFSPDSESGITEYLKRIDEGRLKGIGFAEHLDFLPECGALGFLDYPSYKKEVGRHRENGYQIFAGAEVDYATRVVPEILERLKQETYDYTICSIHMVQGKSLSDRNIDDLVNKDSFRTIVSEYYKELKEGLRIEAFDVIGHIGVFKRYIEAEFYIEHNLKPWLDELDFEAARICADSNKIIEVNTSGLFATVQSVVPGELFLREYYNMGGRTISLSSDAHNAVHAGRGFDIAVSLLKSIGFDYLYLPWDKENPIKIP
ncbi:MAG: histidinol-phosphatase HisJ family protein [Clostridia bacterium]|nr:histidinol-phosphatase HisJ family protein [Clostridia bacterium]